MKTGNPKVAIDYYQRALNVKDDVLIRTSLGNVFRADDPTSRSPNLQRF
jgi:uncharacterized glyoxalase superfamily protein PhnB